MTRKQDPLTIDELLSALDGTGSDAEWKAVFELRARLKDNLPDHLLRKYRKSRRWQVRSSCVYHSLKFARTSEAAKNLGLLALHDRSKVVRYRACMLLACTQRNDVLPALSDSLSTIPSDTRDDLLAAIDAISHGNKNYFVDRDHSGMTTLNY